MPAPSAPNSDPTPISDAARAAITASGLSIGELARLADVSHSVVSRFRAGGEISLATLDRLAGPLGLALVKPEAPRKGGRRRR